VDWRRAEMVAFGIDVVPLNRSDATAAYDRATQLCSPNRYGLDETKITGIECLDVKVQEAEVRAWLAERVGEGELLVVYSQDHVFRVPVPLFLDSWQDMFGPSRDDVVIVPISGGWVLFYWHEDEFEYARL
jgi:hypothetical protein